MQGITRASIKLSPAVPGLVMLTIVGRGGTYPVSPLPPSVTVVLDPPYAESGQCAQASFAGPAPACRVNASGSTVTCR